MTRQSAVRGILGFFVILMMMPLGHAFVVLMGRHLSGASLTASAICLGFAGICIAIAGNRVRGEAMQVLCGAFGSILFWGAWVEFIFISYASSLHVAPLMDGDRILTKPEYLMMPVTIPFAVLTFIMYLYGADTHWGVMLFLRKALKINCTPKNDASRRSSTGAFIDLTLLIWWAYLILLVEYDPDILGDRHPVTLASASICLIASIILFVRSLRAPSWASSLRQSIVTVCVLWTFVEVMIRLKLFTEIWIYPERYVIEMILIAAAFVTAILLLAFLGHKKYKALDGNQE